MNSEFEIFLLESDILYEKANLFILKNSIICESDDAIIEAEKQQKDDEKKLNIKERIIEFIKKVIEKIKGIFHHAESSISKLNQTENINSIIDNVKESIKKDPELAKKEIDTVDINVINEFMKESKQLQERTIDQLSKCVTKDEVEKIVEDYITERDKQIKKREKEKAVKKAIGGLIATAGVYTIWYGVLTGKFNTLINKFKNGLSSNLDKEPDNDSEPVIHAKSSAYTMVSRDAAYDAMYHAKEVQDIADDFSKYT